jgi:hypothetical protein
MWDRHSPDRSAELHRQYVSNPGLDQHKAKLIQITDSGNAQRPYEVAGNTFVSAPRLSLYRLTSADRLRQRRQPLMQYSA